MSKLLSFNIFFLKRCLNITPKRDLLNNQNCLLSTSKQSSIDKLSEKSVQKQSDKVPSKLKKFHKYIQVMDVPEGVFQGKTDRFNGVTVDTSEEYGDLIVFGDKLQKSLSFWTENGRRGIWFKVQTSHSECVPELTKHGFDFHHAKKGYVMMFKWLPTNESANVPVFAHTLCGVGGLVVNDKNEILAVSDKYALIPSSWKLPGGYVEPSENFVNAAIREIQEETGVETTFDTIVAFRHSHGGSFGCSDLYIVIALKPTTSELKACPREISRVKWMPVTEFLNHPQVHETNRQFVRTFMHYKESGIKFNCTDAIHQILKRKYSLYLVEKQST